VSPLGLLCWRFTIAAAVLWVVVIVRRPPLPNGAGLVRLLGLGGVVLAGEVALYFFGLQHLDAGLAEVLLFLFPAWVVVIGAVVARRAPPVLVVGCTVAAVVGAALCVGASAGDRTRSAGFLLGVGLLVAASVAYACYVVLADGAVARHGALIATTVVVTGAAVSFLCAASLTGASMPGTAQARWAAIGMAVVSTVLAFGLLSAGLARLGSARAAVIATSEPVMAVLLGAWLLGERLTWLQGVGMAMVVAAITVIVWRGPVAAVIKDS
jgi:drug/metabolite transporter (DMT)-like permease